MSVEAGVCFQQSLGVASFATNYINLKYSPFILEFKKV